MRETADCFLPEKRVLSLCAFGLGVSETPETDSEAFAKLCFKSIDRQTSSTDELTAAGKSQLYVFFEEEDALLDHPKEILPAFSFLGRLPVLGADFADRGFDLF